MPNNPAANLEGRTAQRPSVRAAVRALVDGEHVRLVMAPAANCNWALKARCPHSEALPVSSRLAGTTVWRRPRWVGRGEAWMNAPRRTSSPGGRRMDDLRRLGTPPPAATIALPQVRVPEPPSHPVRLQHHRYSPPQTQALQRHQYTLVVLFAWSRGTHTAPVLPLTPCIKSSLAADRTCNISNTPDERKRGTDRERRASFQAAAG